MPVYIYALIDPESGEIKYVGKSKNPQYRLTQHIATARRNTDQRRNSRWIRYLIKQEKLPQLKILTETTDENWQVDECRWIELCKQMGFDLNNHTSGGDGIHNPDAESRLHLSEARKTLFQDPCFKERMLLVSQNPERRKKISEKLRGRTHSPEHVAKLPQNQKGHRLSSETKYKISQALMGNQYRKGAKNSEKQIRLLKERMLGNQYTKGRKMTDEDKRRRSESQKGRPKSEEHREKIRKALKESWARRKSQ